MRSRVLTSLVLAPVVLIACVLESPIPLFAICLVVTTIAFWELRELLHNPKTLPVLTLFSLAVPFFGVEVQRNRDPLQVMLYACLFWIVGVLFAVGAVRSKSPQSASVDLSGLWISMPMTCLLMLHRLMPLHRPYPTYKSFLLLILIPLWMGDIAALLVGKRFGRHPMAPKISPNKSWEGSVANVAACVLTSLALVPLLGDQRWVPLHILCGLTIGLFGQAGDLFESWLKRLAGVKDSGTILPGHGGVLDRVDSLLFSAPAASALLIIAFRR